MSTEASFEETVLPNGQAVYCQNPAITREIYDQIEVYFALGVELQPGAIVFDVGANIGVFTLMADRICQQDIRVFAFEPMPETFAVLKANLARVPGDRLRALHCGLSDKAGRVEFAFHPNMTTISTAYPDDEDELRDELKSSILRNIKATGPQLRWIRWLPRFIRSKIVDKSINTMFEAERVECEMRTASDVIREHGLERIDLLKVDVEKSELDVLSGIEAADWPKIQQVVGEVHDLDGRLQIFTDLLRTNGLTEIKVEQEPALAGSNVHSVYARRPA